MFHQIGIWGLVFIVVAGLLFFVPKRIPEIGRSLGRGMREFKDGVTGKDEASLTQAKDGSEG